jgi:hypothetical protein
VGGRTDLVVFAVAELEHAQLMQHQRVAAADLTGANQVLPGLDWVGLGDVLHPNKEQRQVAPGH